MANKDKLGSLVAHIDKSKKSLDEALKGNIPPKHVEGKDAYIAFLRKEVSMHEAKLAKMKG